MKQIIIILVILMSWGLELHALQNDSTHISLSREGTYGSTEEVIVGDIATLTVDDQNRVFITDTDQTTIHVFNPDGSYLTSLGREGKGPGEFAQINRHTSMAIHSNSLMVSDFYFEVPKGIEIFRLKGLNFSHSIKLLAENRHNYKVLQGYYPTRFFPLNNGTLLVTYRQPFDQYDKKASLVYYVIQDSDGFILRGPVIKQKGLTYLSSQRGPIKVMHDFPFHGKPLIAVSDEDYLYAARTEEFKIQVYDSKGEQINTIQHSFEDRDFDEDKVLTRYNKTGYMEDKLGERVPLKMIREADNLPETWPALETMFFDDEDRLWVATIIESDEVYEWWVLKKSGELITKVKWPRDKPIEVVNNGYMYTRETDEQTGIQEIVRYEIELDS
ncbi:6-bladed beta-propeller [Aliifodinibius sp. S!AR15-10]|uniref:6-bladed beta-propeller n=1 Tax=Aliifodinibius sp. S!AR15-10 TaxID=2950437 RepID=UPI002859980C|nr:6-bladed beta-propeller [Aliifodinibius sp. S!AR15-10]MDR8394659.1 6-bladed beta-propeller [Aliifodinibius sp. S!AR15-10]